MWEFLYHFALVPLSNLYLIESRQKGEELNIRTEGVSSASTVTSTPVESWSEMRNSPLPPGDDSKAEFVERGMRLLLTACQRVLSLSEQRVREYSIVLAMALSQNKRAITQFPGFLFASACFFCSGLMSVFTSS